jgi:hypothetical protein
VLLTADGVGTNEIMRRTAKSKTCVWRWQERFLEDGFDGPKRQRLCAPSGGLPRAARAARRNRAMIGCVFAPPSGVFGADQRVERP